jgi:hypothetical protein
MIAKKLLKSIVTWTRCDRRDVDLEHAIQGFPELDILRDALCRYGTIGSDLGADAY